MSPDKLLVRTLEILGKYKIRLKKRWGQNLLIDGRVLKRIIEVSDLIQDNLVIEIGAGIGTLTKALADYGVKVIAIELDNLFCALLKEELKGYPNISIVQGDALKVDLREYASLSKDGKLKVIANLPYYITSPLILHLLKYRDIIDTLTLMVQEEVARRIIAPPGGKDYGTLSIAIQYYTEAKIMELVSKRAFLPEPQVDSAILRLKVLKEPRVPLRDEGLFFALVRGAFGQRRKTLLKALMGMKYPPLNRDALLEALKWASIDPKRRGETLSIEEFAHLAEAIAEIQKLSLRDKQARDKISVVKL